MKQQLKILAREGLLLLNRHRPGSEKNIFIFSIPRSGSTWLQELIWSQPGFKYVNEPFNLKGNYLQEKSGIQGFEELYRPQSREKVISYLQGFVSGRYHFLDPNPLRKFYRPFTNRLVFKIIHGGELFINDIAVECNGEILYLIRNPIAVALSRKQLPRMEQLASEPVLSLFSETQRKLAREIISSNDGLARRVLAWCLQNRLALMHRRPEWLVITYEQMAIDPEPVINRMVKQFQLPKPSILYSQLHIPSAVTVQSEMGARQLIQGTEHRRQSLIERWKHKITEVHADELMSICKAFDLDIYDQTHAYPKAEWLVPGNPKPIH